MLFEELSKIIETMWLTDYRKDCEIKFISKKYTILYMDTNLFDTLSRTVIVKKYKRIYVESKTELDALDRDIRKAVRKYLYENKLIIPDNGDINYKYRTTRHVIYIGSTKVQVVCIKRHRYMVDKLYPIDIKPKR